MHHIESPFISISVLYRKSHIWLSNSCAQCGLTAPQALVILIVCDFKGLTQEDITMRLSLDKSVIAKTVAKLVETKFLVRTPNAKDKRTYDILPTDKAWEAYPFVKRQIDDCFHRMTRQMTEQEQIAFNRLLSLAAETTVTQED